MSDPLRNHVVGFLMTRLNIYFDKIFESEAVFPLQWDGNYGRSLYSIIFVLPRFGTIFCLPKKTQNHCPTSGVFTHKIHEYCTIDHEINICSEKSVHYFNIKPNQHSS